MSDEQPKKRLTFKDLLGNNLEDDSSPASPGQEETEADTAPDDTLISAPGRSLESPVSEETSDTKDASLFPEVDDETGGEEKTDSVIDELPEPEKDKPEIPTEENSEHQEEDPSSIAFSEDLFGELEDVLNEELADELKDLKMEGSPEDLTQVRDRIGEKITEPESPELLRTTVPINGGDEDSSMENVEMERIFPEPVDRSDDKESIPLFLRTSTETKKEERKEATKPETLSGSEEERKKEESKKKKPKIKTYGGRTAILPGMNTAADSGKFSGLDDVLEQEPAPELTETTVPEPTVLPDEPVIDHPVPPKPKSHPKPKGLKPAKKVKPEPEPEEEEVDRKFKKQKKPWGYGWVLVILLTAFGSVTIATYMVLLKTNVTIPNVLVNVSVFALLFFLIIIMVRYFILIMLSFFHHSMERSSEEVKGKFKIKKATVLVPAYNEGMVIDQSLESLLKLNYPEYEIIVINDGSTDDTLEKARKWEGMHGKVRIRVLTQENKGKAEALNHGATKAKGEVVVCMDGDSKLDPNTLNAGMRHFDDPVVAAVAGNVKVVNRDKLITKLQALEYIEGLNLVRRAQAFIHAVNIVPGPIGLFRTEALLEVGGWSNDTFAEDCDLTLKLLTRKYKIDYEPDAVSYTEAPEELFPLLKQRYRWTRGILQSMRKHSSYLIRPAAGWRVLFTMWQMVLEAVLWPLMNILANVFFIIVAILFGISPLLVLWWVQLTILDTIAAMHAIAIERESIALVPYAVVYRLVFIQFVDVAKMIATVEELIGIKMGWGKLERKGRL